MKTKRYIAAALGVDTATVRAYLAQGKLKGKFEGVGNRGNWQVDVDSARARVRPGATVAD